MLINVRQLSKYWGLKPTRVVHVGAHECEEFQAYKLNGWGVEQTTWIEANPEKATTCTKIVDQYPNQTVICALLSDRTEDEVDFYLSSNGESSSMLRPTGHLTLYPHIRFDRTITLKTTRADEILSSTSVEGAFLNVDVQGSELVVLRGFGALLRQFGAIYCEVTKRSLYEGDSTWAVLDSFLQSMGFQCVDHHILDDGWGDALWLPRGSLGLIRRQAGRIRRLENKGLSLVRTFNLWAGRKQPKPPKLIGSRASRQSSKRSLVIAESDHEPALTGHDVTAIIPTIGRPSLKTAVQSVLSQTVALQKILVCVDGYEHLPEVSVLLGDLAKHPRVQVVCCETSGSPARPRNMGVSIAETKLVAFCDDDDSWLPNKLELQLAEFQLETVLVAANAIRTGNRDGSNYFEGSSRHVTFKELFRSNPIITSTVVCRKESLASVGGFPYWPPLLDDYGCWLRLIHEGSAFVDAQPLIVYATPSDGHVSVTVKQSIRDPVGKCLLSTFSWSLSRRRQPRILVHLLFAIAFHEFWRLIEALRLRLRYVRPCSTVRD